MTRRGVISAIAASVTAMLGQEPREDGLAVEPLATRFRLSSQPTNEPFAALEINLSGSAHVFKLTYEDRAVFISPQEVMDALTPPRNGQCPCCGVQAPSWSRWYKSGFEDCKGTGDGLTVTCTDRFRQFAETQRLVRCSQCSVAFWQDAEKEDGKG
jgi:hypothetical protein